MGEELPLYDAGTEVRVRISDSWVPATVIGNASYMYTCELEDGKRVTVRSSANRDRNEIDLRS